MLGSQLVVVSDAHLGAAPRDTEEALLAFLDLVPTLGDCLLVNGDLFDFWFAYKRVVPRAGFAAAGALAGLARRIPIVMTGGNHDRWGDSFWANDLGIQFAPAEARLSVGALAILALHGDGVAEAHGSATMIHRITRSPLTTGLYRLLHPDLGFILVDWMSRHFAEARDPAVLDQAALRQEAWAKERLTADAALGLVVMSHTHRPAVKELLPGRRYLNPGAWIDGCRYAVVTERSVELKVFG